MQKSNMVYFFCIVQGSHGKQELECRFPSCELVFVGYLCSILTFIIYFSCLQIFNSKLVLASPETATDADYAAILGVIGHEVLIIIY